MTLNFQGVGFRVPLRIGVFKIAHEFFLFASTEISGLLMWSAVG